MFIPTRGYIIGDASAIVEPHKIGKVLWAKSVKGYQVPLDLHNQLPVEDEEALNRIFNILMSTRQVRGALDVVYAYGWHRMDLVKPWLMASMSTRCQARMMQATGEWEEFWNIRN